MMKDDGPPKGAPHLHTGAESVMEIRLQEARPRVPEDAERGGRVFKPPQMRAFSSSA